MENAKPSYEDMEFTFHQVIGKNVMIMEDGLYAQRKQTHSTRDNAVVYGSKPIPCRGKCILEVTITENKKKGWGYSVQIGVMRLPTGTELKQSDVPSESEHGNNHCMWRGSTLWNRLQLCDDYIESTSDYGLVDLRNLGKGKISV